MFFQIDSSRQHSTSLDQKRSSLIKVCACAIALILVALAISQAIEVFSNKTPIGDELFYLEETSSFLSQGMWNSFRDGTSHLFVSISGLLSVLVGDVLISNRIIALLMSLIVMLYGYKLMCLFCMTPQLKTIAFLTLSFLIFASQSGRFFYRGVSDSLMIAILLPAVLYLSIFFKTESFISLILSALLCGISLWVRSFSMLIIVGMLLSFLVFIVAIRFKLKTILQFSSYVFLIVFVSLIVQIPSLLETGKLSFENKNRHNDWAAVNWLTSRMRLDGGSIFSYQQPTKAAVADFIQAHPNYLIPKSTYQRFKADPKFAVDNFVSNLFIRIPYILFMNLFMLIVPLVDLASRPLGATDHEFFFFFYCIISTVLIISLCAIIIRSIDHRWVFFSMLTLIPLAVHHLSSYSHKLKQVIIFSQFAAIFIMSSYYLISTIGRAI